MKKKIIHQVRLIVISLSVGIVLAACQSTSRQIPSALIPLQGDWQGQGPGDQYSIIISGNSLRFYERADHWFETTIALHTDTNPQQLHATIENSAPPADSNGEVVSAFFKIEGGTLTLAVFDNENDELPESFEDDSIISTYQLRKVQL